jgi:hypothetical protein
MEKRDNQLKEIRPLLSHLENDKEKTVEEKFQNTVLRPTLKFQHDILMAFITEQVIKKFKIDIIKIHSNDLVLKVKNELTNNQTLRNQVFGVVVGLFTIDEYHEYLKNETEYRRRIMAMVLERYMSSVA